MITYCIHHQSLDPYYNLAVEEYLLKNYKEDFFIIWKSKPSIVVGKHQNALAEINHQFVKDNGINVVRRLSGGGTVFHDPGNLNFTFIQSVKEISEVNFKTFTLPIVEVLKKLNLDAYTTGRNDLMIDEKKISGNAEHVFKKRVLHHGTLLFNSDLKNLKGALKVDLSRFQDRSVQSNRSPVTNIADYLKSPLNVDQFADFMYKEVRQLLPDSQLFELSEEDVLVIEGLKNEKYAQWEWIYGYSPKYVFSNAIKANSGELKLQLRVEKGHVREVRFEGFQQLDKLSTQLLGKRHYYEDFKPLVMEAEAILNNLGLSPQSLLDALF